MRFAVSKPVFYFLSNRIMKKLLILIAALAVTGTTGFAQTSAIGNQTPAAQSKSPGQQARLTHILLASRQDERRSGQRTAEQSAF